MALTNQLGQKAVLLIMAICCFQLAFCCQLNDDGKTILERHEEWAARHDDMDAFTKAAEEKAKHYLIFKINVEFIEAFNKQINVEYQKYTLCLNEFADLTNEEFRAMRNGYKSQSLSNSMKATSFRYGNVTQVPSSVDWRENGAVTPIKDQGKYGCCWAFSAVAATEGINQHKTGNLISLSEQQLVDCDTAGDDHGCEGGLMDSAFQFIESNKGLSTEANYPYQGIDGNCKTQNATSRAASITGHEDVPKNDENALLQAVVNQPISISIDASGSAFQFYSSGVFTGTCGANLDHGVAVVGYGTKYWVVKNSWGTGWGESGYIRMQRDVPAKEGLWNCYGRFLSNRMNTIDGN